MNIGTLGRVEPVVKRRSYTSPLREERARATKRRVLDAAVRLFLASGYAGTTMKAVAEAAGVAPDTVFHLFSNKRGLLKEAMDVVIAGDDEDVPVLERPDPQAMRREPDQRRQLQLFAAGITRQLERVRPMNDLLRSAAAVDPEIAALRDDLQLRQRREGMHTVAGWLTARGELRDSMPTEDAAAILWTLTSPEVHRMLRVDWGWSPEQFERWLAQSLLDMMLPPDA